MASRNQASIALLMCFNLMFFSMVTAQQTCPADIFAAITTGRDVCQAMQHVTPIEAALCICTGLYVGVTLLGLNLGVGANLALGAQVNLHRIMSGCGMEPPAGYICTPPPPIAPSP